MVGKLIAEEGLTKGLILSFDEGEGWVVGRDPEVSQLIIEDPSVSRRHLMTKQTPEGIQIENLSTTNPVLINDIELKGPQLLHQGDTLKIGNSVFRYYLDTQSRLIEDITPNYTGEFTPPPQDQEERHDTIFGDENKEEEAFADISFDLSGNGRWMLKVISGPNSGAEFSMEKEHSYLIGTDTSTCDIVFHDLSVSRQHARITITDDESLIVEDLGSRNGTRVDGEPIQEKKKLSSNALVSLGTTGFIVIDREQERQTIVPPPLSSLGRVVQSEETVQAAQAAVQKLQQQEAERAKQEIPESHHEPARALNALIILAIVTGLFILVGLSTSFLFNTEEVAIVKVDTNAQLAQSFKDYPSLRYSFSKPTGKLLILGHVLSASDRSQLLYNLQALPFVKKIEDNIIIDELVWQEANQVLSKNPAWKTITITSPSPGRFVLSGGLKTRTEADVLSDYLSLNFPYPELLERKLIVEEEIIGEVNRQLEDKGFRDVVVELNNTEVILNGYIPFNKEKEWSAILSNLKETPGIRNVRDLTIEQAPEETTVNISNKYTVTGFSNRGGTNTSVVINGRILTVGDTLDGMKIINIRPGTVHLEKDRIKYRIDYNK